MIIVPPTKPVDWTSDDAATLKKLLESSTGVRLFQLLAQRAPELLDGSHPNKALVASGVVAGYQDAISTIVRLTYDDPNEAPPPPPSDYQSLDDDSAWKDIEKKVDKNDETQPS